MTNVCRSWSGLDSVVRGLTINQPCMYACIMATKTISIDLEAYERLRQARRAPDESFSRVIKRAQWPNEARTAAGLLSALRNSPPPEAAVIERLEEAQEMDRPPEDMWHTG